ncbi:RING zinc finger-containing protein, partial [Reticulomyxa filosa]
MHLWNTLDKIIEYFVVVMFRKDLTDLVFLLNCTIFLFHYPFFLKINLKIFLNVNNMGNRTTTQNSPERETKLTKQIQQLNTHFQTLKELPIPLKESQCILHKYEILICGGYKQRACYSYHILKNEYKFICEYPSHVELDGHCVVKLVDNNNNNKHRNQITLFSVGSDQYGKNKHTLVMKYVSVWSDDNNNDENKNEVNKSKELNESNQLNKSNNYNQWVRLRNKYNRPIIIGNGNSNYIGMRAVIGGINNHLLFITYQYNNISVLDLNTFQIIKNDTLPINNLIKYHCF